MSSKHPNGTKEKIIESTANINANSDESVIEGSPANTPIKKKLKRIRNKARRQKKTVEKVQNNETDILEQLVKEFNKNETQNNLSCAENHDTKSDSRNLPNEQNEQLGKTEQLEVKNMPLSSSQSQSTVNNIALTYRGITEPIYKPVSKNYHNLYVFYLISEVLQFTPNNFPKNSCVQLIGLLNYYGKGHSPFLSSYEKKYGKSYQIKLNLREISLKPDYNEKITLFGMISFENDSPIVVANFYQASTIAHQAYVDLMLRLRTTVPLENFDMICLSDDDLKWDETLNEESDEEELLNELTFKLSGECFETDDLSDSVLCAFLDDISFENMT